MSLLCAINPYRDCDFFSFFGVFLSRIVSLVTGRLPVSDLASDEIQIFVLLGLSLSSALVGSFLVLKKMTMTANALSHTVLLGIVLSFLLIKPFITSDATGSFLSLKILLIASFLSGLLTVFLIQLLIQVAKISEDASVGFVFSFLFALGILLVTLYTRNAHIGTEAIMGNIDALELKDLKMVFVVAGVNLAAFVIFMRGFSISTFDPSYASTIGMPVHFLNYLLMVMTSATCIASFRSVGVLLVISFFVGPALMARLLIKRLRPMLYVSFSLSALASIVAVASSRHILSVYGTPLSTSGLVVCVMTAFYLVLLLFAPQKGLISQKFFQSKP